MDKKCPEILDSYQREKIIVTDRQRCLLLYQYIMQKGLLKLLYNLYIGNYNHGLK